MTQAEGELIAREIRARCLHSSWNDLVGFWQGVMGDLTSAYRTAVQGVAASHSVSSGDPNDMQVVVRDKLGVALSQLEGERQVARWNAEAVCGIESPPSSKAGAAQLEGRQID